MTANRPELVLYNTLTRKKEPFRPMAPGKVGMYVCGITPYDEPHLGHARCYVVFDVLRRVLETLYPAVTHVQNYTDVDDKIIERAAREGVSPAELAERNIATFERWMAALNVKKPHVAPRVTTSIEDIKALVEELVRRGLAYVVDGDVYYAVRKFESYGKLSNRNVDELEAGARVEKSEAKRDPLDFALWKKAKPGEPSWESAWGKGRPGWHIECSAMAMKELGEEFDLHGGGQDLIFPHHENEIAQSVGATQKGFARYWMHNGFVTINREKMSKSLGNFFTIREIAAKYDPMVIRYYLLSQHYRSPLNFSDKELDAAQTAWQNRIVDAYRVAEERGGPAGEPTTYPDDEFLAETLLDDLNTPAALADINSACTKIFADQKRGTIDRDGWHAHLVGLQSRLEILGLKVPSEERWPDDIIRLAEARQAARKAKDFAESDRLRDALKTKGVLIEDTPQGPRLKRLS